MAIKKVSKWTEQLVFDESKKYTTKSDFFRNSSGAYQAAKKLGVFEKACEHMKSKKWTLESLKAEALNYTTRSDFMRGSRSAHVMASRLGLIEQISSHMDTKQEKWSADKAIAIASNYTSLIQFRDEQPNAYAASIRYGVHHIVSSGMHCRRTWSNDEIHELALGFNTVGEFRIKCNNQYMYASNRGILSKITSHMNASVARQNMLYCISSADTHENGMYLVKIGVSSTFRVEQRVLRHMRNHFTSANIVFITESEVSRKHESYLLGRYERLPYNMRTEDGSTELRLVTGEELCAIIDYGNSINRDDV